jgi:hypothetical protein
MTQKSYRLVQVRLVLHNLMSPSPISRAGHPPGGKDGIAIFVDLDGTLIADATDKFEKRPGADSFLEKCSKIGTLYLFTASTRSRAHKAVNAMGWGKRFEDILSRENIQGARTPPTCRAFVMVDNTPEIAKIKLEYLMSSPGIKFSTCGSLIEAMSGALDLSMDEDPVGTIVHVETYVGGKDNSLEATFASVCDELSKIVSLPSKHFLLA